MTTLQSSAAMPHFEGGLWLSITDIARLEKKTRQAVSKRVAALVAAGEIATKRGENGSKLVNLAAYNRAIGAVGDAAKELAAETRADAATDAPAADGKPTYRDAQTRKLQFEADLAEIALAEKRAELVPVADVEDAAARVAEAIVRVIDRLTSYAEPMANAVGKDGVPGARAMFKEISRDLRTAAAEAMTHLADVPPNDQNPTAGS